MYINFPVRAIHDERTDAGVDKSRPAALQVRRQGAGPHLRPRHLRLRGQDVFRRPPAVGTDGPALREVL